MTREKERMVFCILRALCSAGKPLGSNNLAVILKRQGFRISPPSISRLLVLLEEEGYLLKRGNQGRVLSEKGKVFLDSMVAERERKKIAAELLADANEENPEKLLDLLIARRALEREAVRLAAHNASDREIQELMAYAAILDEVVVTLEYPYAEGHIATLGEKFHYLIACASKNSFLVSALDLISRNEALRDALWSLAEQQKKPIENNHLKIAEAIRNRDPEAAEKAALDHIDVFVNLLQLQIDRRAGRDDFSKV